MKFKELTKKILWGVSDIKLGLNPAIAAIRHGHMNKSYKRKAMMEITWKSRMKPTVASITLTNQRNSYQTVEKKTPAGSSKKLDQPIRKETHDKRCNMKQSHDYS